MYGSPVLDATWDEMVGEQPGMAGLAQLLAGLRAAQVPFRHDPAAAAGGGGRGGSKKRPKAQQ